MENPSGAVAGNSQNNPTQYIPRTRSTFPLKYHFFDTHRFGEYHPHYVEDSVKTDVLPLRSSHNVMSYTLKSPLMQDITMHKDYFSVPMEAILPNNWEKFFVNPVRGDDVSQDVGPSVADFWKLVASLSSSLSSNLNTLLAASGTTQAQGLQATLRFLVVLEYFYSNGSLMASLGCHGAPYITCVNNNQVFSYDTFFDDMIANIVQVCGSSYLPNVSIDGYTYVVSSDSSSRIVNGLHVISWRHFLSLIRDNPTFTITSFTGTASGSLISAIQGVLSDWTFTFKSASVPFNLSRLAAYQLCCAHYYTNDHIDFVYSAELYRQLVGSYILSYFGTNLNARSFTRNGIKYEYDYLSAHYCSSFLSTGAISSSANNMLIASSSGTGFYLLGYFSALFAYRRSLRYQDYFTGSRSQPLAVGSTGVSVSNNTVDVIDVTRNIQKQRFLNAVNRVRHNLEGYLSDIFGGDVPAPDYHNPFYLANTTDTVFGQETENTGANQMSDKLAITSNLRSNGSRYMFEIHSDRNVVVLGITHYDLPRVYGRSMERSFLHQDRFDMFNPFMQFTGDQAIYLQELGIDPVGSALASMQNFAYTLKYMEYKQRYNQAAGGFVENLPGFIFLANDERGNQATINPDWIRSVPSEFDDFYVKLEGYSNGSYFHFIVDTFNDCSGSRPMAYAPSIL